MKIGFVLDDRLDKPDGVQQYVKQVGTWLTVRGHDVHYLVGDSPAITDAKVHNMSRTVKVRFNKNRMEMPLPASKKAIRTLLESEQFDVLHVQMPYSPLLAGRVVAAAGPGTAVVGTFHILPHGALSSAGTRLLSAWLHHNKKRFDAFLSVSSAAQSFAKSHFGITSVVMPNVVELSTYRKGRPLRQYADRFNIVFLGRLVTRKGAPYLLEAYNLLLQAHPDLATSTRLIICGDGPDRTVHEKTAEVIRSSHAAEIIFTGFLDEKDKPDYLASANIAVFPSTGGEAFGIVLIEAMAARAGVVLAGDNPGYRSVLGILPGSMVTPRNSADFASQLYKTISDTPAARKLYAAQQQLVEQFDINIVGKNIEAIYQDALAARRNKGDTKSNV